MKLTLEIPPGLLREAEAFAAGHAKSMDALVADALRRVLPVNGTSPARRRSPAATRWLQQWEDLVEAVDRERRSGRNAREILRQSRR